MKKHFLLFSVLLLGLLILSLLAVTTRASAEGEPAAWYPNPAHASNYDQFPNPAYSNILYLSVGFGEHVTGLTSTEVYVSSTGTVTVNIVRGTTCYGTQPGGGNVDIPGGTSYFFNTWYAVYDETGGALIANTGPIGYDCANQDRAISFAGVAGRTYILYAEVINSNASGENLYRLNVTSGNATLGVGGSGWGGISLTNRDLVSGHESAYAMYFTTPCTQTAVIPSTGLRFSDADVGNYQSTGSYPDLFVVLLSRPKGSSVAWTQIVNQTLTGGDKAIDNLPAWVTFPADQEFLLQIFNITRPNALEVLLDDRFTQLGVGQSCLVPPPTGNISLVCTVNTGTSTATIYVRKGNVNDPGNRTMNLNVNIGATNSTPDTANFTNATAAGTNLVQFSVARQTTNYTVAGTVTAGSSTLNVSNSVNCPPASPPGVSIQPGYNCEQLVYRITSSENMTFTAQLYINGAPSSPAVTQTNRARNTSYTISIGNWRDFNSRNFSVRVFNAAAGVENTSAGVPVPPCVRINCSGALINPSGGIQVGTEFTANLQFSTYQNYGSNLPLAIQDYGALEDYNISYSMSPALPGAPPSPLAGTLIRHVSSVSQLVTFTASGAPGTYTLTFGITGDSQPNLSATGCTVQVTIVAMPYFQAFRGDVIAGYGIRDATGVCSTAASNINASIANDVTNAAEYVGSGTQMAAFARGSIIGFRTAIVEPGRNNRPWTRIFANSSPPADVATATSFGGNFDSSLCAENWFDDMPTTLSSSPGSRVNVGGLSGVVGYQGPVSFSYGPDGGLGTPISGSRKIFVNGDILIGGGNAGAQVYSYADGNWTINSIPTAIFVATGNIFIDDNLTRLDAILVAGGTVFTCVPTAGAPLPSASTSLDTYEPARYAVGGTCNSLSFTMNGAIIADSARLWRTGGSMSDATPYQDFADGLTGAETLRLSPEIFVASRAGEDPINGEDGVKQFDALISLPPPF